MREHGKPQSLHLHILILITYIATSCRDTFVDFEDYFSCYALLTVYHFVNREFQHVQCSGIHKGVGGISGLQTMVVTCCSLRLTVVIDKSFVLEMCSC